MDYLENIKKFIADGSKKVSEAAEHIGEKIREVGEEGIEITKEMIAEAGEKTSDIVQMTQLKREINHLKKDINEDFTNLGEITFKLHTARTKAKVAERFKVQVDRIDHMKQELKLKEENYTELRKQYSGNYVISKLSDELAEGDAAIDQVTISANSTVIKKSLKEIVLPKETLISAIKRDEEIIIPDGNTKIAAGDIVTLIGKRKDIKKATNTLQ